MWVSGAPSELLDVAQEYHFPLSVWISHPVLQECESFHRMLTRGRPFFGEERIKPLNKLNEERRLSLRGKEWTSRIHMLNIGRRYRFEAGNVLSRQFMGGSLRNSSIRSPEARLAIFLCPEEPRAIFRQPAGYIGYLLLIQAEDTIVEKPGAHCALKCGISSSIGRIADRP
jgi:hypothetical protein